MAEETKLFQPELSAEEAAKQEAMLEKHEKAARTRKFGSPTMNKGLALFCFLFTVYHLVIASGMVSIQNLKHHAIHVGLILILSFVLYPAWEKASRKKIAWYDYIFTAIAIAEPIYVFLRYDAFISTGFKPNMVDLVMGTLLVILVLEATRRISGAALPILCIIFLLYGMFGRYVPIDLFRHRGYTWAAIMKNKYSDEFAGAVVATASVGGQLMSPIMGAAAFVMAETLGVKYAVIVTAAIIPAIVYYSGILFQVQLRANKDKMYGLPKDQLPKVGVVLKERGHLLIPIIFLVSMMFLSGWTVLKIAFWSIIITIAVAELRPISRMSLKDIYDAFAQAAKSTVSVAISCACVGIIVGVCSQTGFALNIASAIISIGRNAFPTIPALSLFLTLLFTMVTCMILGMGLPSIPSYLITATIAAPALIQLGVPDLAAHMFCFYFAMFANLTPPVALASFAAAGISGGNPMKTGWVSVKLAIAGFIVPYMFVYNQGLLLYGVNFFSGAWILFTSIIGVALISVAAEGFLYAKVPIPVRVVSAATAILLISSEPISDVVGLALFVAIVLFQRVRGKREALKAA